jgi:hypothetical protein
MATRSAIALETGIPELELSGVIHSVYCHWDGYPEHNGKLLHEVYNTYRSVSALLSGGSISSLAESFEKTEFHHRDMGRELEPVSTYDNRDEFIAYSRGLDYLYLFNQNDAWEVYEFATHQWHNLAELLEYRTRRAKAA